VKIAHFSDLHVLALEGVGVHRFLNKRLTGWANLRLKRNAVHHTELVHAIARAVSEGGYDHVICTGDLTNLALESEFAAVRAIFDRELDLDPARVTVVPGNHDLYTRGARTTRRFERYFADWLRSDLPALAAETSAGLFPVVKLRGDLAIVGLSSAVPRPPFVAAGELGKAQLDALARILAHPEVASRTVIVALHHPAVRKASARKQYLDGLRDAPALLSVLRSLRRGLVLHGHLHRRVQCTITTTDGRLLQVGATSASLQSPDPDRMAGYNVYDVAPDGAITLEARVYDKATSSFRAAGIPSGRLAADPERAPGP
jgi:3',5'-cyclic AMP phosphodiesterase CpdA